MGVFQNFNTWRKNFHKNHPIWYWILIIAILALMAVVVIVSVLLLVRFIFGGKKKKDNSKFVDKTFWVRYPDAGLLGGGRVRQGTWGSKGEFTEYVVDVGSNRILVVKIASYPQNTTKDNPHQLTAGTDIFHYATNNKIGTPASIEEVKSWGDEDLFRNFMIAIQGVRPRYMVQQNIAPPKAHITPGWGVKIKGKTEDMSRITTSPSPSSPSPSPSPPSPSSPSPSPSLPSTDPPRPRSRPRPRPLPGISSFSESHSLATRSESARRALKDVEEARSGVRPSGEPSEIPIKTVLFRKPRGEVEELEERPARRPHDSGRQLRIYRGQLVSLLGSKRNKINRRLAWRQRMTRSPSPSLRARLTTQIANISVKIAQIDAELETIRGEITLLETET